MAQTSTAASTQASDDYVKTAAGSTELTGANKDMVESTIRSLDQSTKSATGTSLFHILTVASIGASVALFLSGKKSAGIFVGLWPPTFQALKSVADTNKENRK
ncbi:MAG TPA: hypothetical protein VM943_04765 [Pyrinomonadaceae bacterium]|nr:hypothetical protein [Pyrinomonadaceae bacterium]